MSHLFVFILQVDVCLLSALLLMSRLPGQSCFCSPGLCTNTMTAGEKVTKRVRGRNADIYNKYLIVIIGIVLFMQAFLWTKFMVCQDVCVLAPDLYIKQKTVMFC